MYAAIIFFVGEAIREPLNYLTRSLNGRPLKTVLDRIPLQLTVCSNKPHSVVGRSQLRQITNDHTYFYHTEQVV